MSTVSGRGGPSDGSRTVSERMADLMVLVADDRDRRAFAELYAWFAPRVKGFLIRRGLDAQRAEEVAQEAMLTVWRKADRFDRRQASVATWIFTIARNRSIDELRREKRPEIELDDPTLVGDGLAQPAETAYAAGQEAERLKAAIGTLPEEQARLLHMAFFEDKSHSAIAESEDLPLGTVKSRLRLALSKLRAALGPVH
nr:sigma-70 family RNA polymerase sigma factor [uncultured Tistrella sp.]